MENKALKCYVNFSPTTHLELEAGCPIDHLMQSLDAHLPEMWEKELLECKKKHRNLLPNEAAVEQVFCLGLSLHHFPYSPTALGTRVQHTVPQ